MNIVLFGPPGSGKGTQSALLVKELGMYQISTGDLFREAIRLGTPLGLQVKEIMRVGGLVPDNITIGFFEETLAQLEEKKGRKDGFIFDGFPRTLDQAKALKSFLSSKKLELQKAVFLEVSKDVLLRRLTGRRFCTACGTIYNVELAPTMIEQKCNKCGGALAQRPDDKDDAVVVRLEKYQQSTLPLKKYYEDERVLVSINGSRSEKEVFLDLKQIVSDEN